MKLTEDSHNTTAPQIDFENIDPLANLKKPSDIIDIRNVKLADKETTHEKVIRNDQILNEQLLMDITNIKNLTIESNLNEKESSKSEKKSNENELNDTQVKAVDEFLKIQNWSTSDAKLWNVAVKFLMARKFDVERAIKLYNEHEILRKREGLDQINLNDEAFQRDLRTGKFTILPFVKNYPICALFTVRLHSNVSDVNNELLTLRTLVYQLDAALENPDAQRNGINFIYDMNNCKRANYDLALSQKILTLVKGAYPARLNKLLVVSAPFWFKCVVKVLSILMREKLRERVVFVTNEELKTHIPSEILPDHLGGLVKLNHQNWLIECNKLVTNAASTCSYYYCFSSSLSNSTNGANSSLAHNRKRQLSDMNDLSDKKQLKKNTIQNDKTALNIAEKIEPLPSQNFYQSIQNFDDNGMSADELVQHVISIQAYGLSEEFKEIRNQPISSIDVFKSRENEMKNRYRDVVCLDLSRVKLELDSHSKANESQLAHSSDYIHANFVDGYKQKNAYISTQGPLDETISDFWCMIWEQCVLVIVMTTKVIEQNRIKCAQYWPLVKGEILKIESLFEITNLQVEDLGDFKLSKLAIKHLPTDKTRTIIHCHFLSWPDHGVPKTASQILSFINLVRKSQVECLKSLNSSISGRSKWTGHPLGPPICVHCSAGIGRTGTFITIDICINKLNDGKKINLENTVKKIRSQRAQSVQMRDQYVFCYLAIIEYALKEKMLTNQNFNIREIFTEVF